MQKKLNKKFIFLLMFLKFSLSLYAINLSEISETRLLENYSVIKSKNVERVVNEDDYDRDKTKNMVYVHGETIPFTGVGITKKNGRIIKLSFYKNGKANGESYFYTMSGKLEGVNVYQNDEIIKIKSNYEDKNGMYHIYEQIKDSYGIKTNYYKNGQMAAKINVRLEDSGEEYTFVKQGETTVYEKSGEIKGILNFKNDSAYGLPQKLFKNGKLKYEFISAAEVGEKLETMTYFKEYFDKSDKLKLDCDEVSSGEWHCKEYKKDGTLKNEFTSPTYKPKKDNSFWINAFLGIWNILF